MSRIQLQMVDHSVSSDWWKKLVNHFVRTGDALEIRCWKEETSEIQQASLYGTPVKGPYEVSVRGTVTAVFLTELLTEEPTDKNRYNKMTKYFSINIKNELCDFCSEHYGTEMYINGLSDHDVVFFQTIMAPYGDAFSIGIET